MTRLPTWNVLAALVLLLLVPEIATAAALDGRYSGKLALIGGAECGEPSEEFWAEVKGNKIRVFSPSAGRAFDGVIADNGRFMVGGMLADGSERRALEWNGQISSASRALGTLSVRGEKLCQFIFSLERSPKPE